MAKSLGDDQLTELIECLQFVADPRVKGRSKHLLIDVLVLSVCAILCGAEGVTEIQLFGEQKEEWLKRHLSLSSGIPSHDTIGRILSLVDQNQFEIAFTHWVQDALVKKREINTISLDGKSTNGTERGFNAKARPLHMVSAYSHELGLTLTQSESQSSGMAEGDAAIACLKVLDLKDVTVLADAGLASKKVVEQITGQNGNYLVPVKGNQRLSMQEIEREFSSKKISKSQTLDLAHGREERRRCRVLPAGQLSERFLAAWPKAKTVFEMTRTRIREDKRYTLKVKQADGSFKYEKNEGDMTEKTEVTFYVTSLKLTPKQAMAEARKHWGIENKVHWILDVAFSEDEWTVRSKKLARNLSLIRKIALNLIRNSKTKGSVKGRMKKAGWSTDFLETLLFGS